MRPAESRPGEVRPYAPVRFAQARSALSITAAPMQSRHWVAWTVKQRVLLVALPGETISQSERRYIYVAPHRWLVSPKVLAEGFYRNQRPGRIS